MAADQGDKQEKPTHKRLKDARERGQVARSKELAAAVGLCLCALGLVWFGAATARALAGRVATDLQGLDRLAHVAIDADILGAMVLERSRWFAMTLAPLGALALLAATVGNLAQGGGGFAPKALELKWDRLSPASGMQRFKPSKAGADLVRAAIALTVLSLLTVPLVRDVMGRAPELVGLSPAAAAAVGWDQLWRLLWRGAIALLVLGVADFAYQRWTWLRGLRMSRQEVRDESKLQDGNPETKARVRRIQREISKRRMLADVRTSTVVITNPTHYAVALTYQRSRMAAPVLVAKGKDALAARIRQEARAHGVPLIENPPLARALHASGEVGLPIPSELFTAVAEVLAYLVRIRQLIL